MENILDVLGIVCPILARILIPLSINFDCRARNLAQRRLFTILCIFFPVIMGIVYAIRRKSLQKAFKVCSKCGSKADPYATNCPKCGGYMLLEYKNPKAKMLKTISIVLCVAGALSYCVGEFVGMPSYIDELKDKLYDVTEFKKDEMVEDEEYLYEDNVLLYDRNGIAYSDYYSIKFYDKDGNVYKIDAESADFADENGKHYPFNNCFVDEDGYFTYFETAPQIDDYGKCMVEDKIYYQADFVSWNYSGGLITPDDSFD